MMVTRFFVSLTHTHTRGRPGCVCAHRLLVCTVAECRGKLDRLHVPGSTSLLPSIMADDFNTSDMEFEPAPANRTWLVSIKRIKKTSWTLIKIESHQRRWLNSCNLVSELLQPGT